MTTELVPAWGLPPLTEQMEKLRHRRTWPVTVAGPGSKNRGRVGRGKGLEGATHRHCIMQINVDPGPTTLSVKDSMGMCEKRYNHRRRRCYANDL